MLGPDSIGPKLMLLDKKRNCAANNFSRSNHFSGESKPDSSNWQGQLGISSNRVYWLIP